MQGIFPSSEVPDRHWSPTSILSQGHQKIFHSVKQTGCEFGHKSAHCQGEELVEPFLHYSCFRGVHRLFTLTVNSQSSGKIKGRQAGLNIKGTSRPKSNKYFCVLLSGLLYTNRLRYLQEGRMPRIFRDVFLRPCFVSFRWS